MTVFYLDTSVAVHALRGTPPAEAWFDDVTGDPQRSLVSSRVLQTELTRVLRRDHVPVATRDLIFRHVGLIDLSEPILAAAEAITEHVRTLDAIHLATAVYTGSTTVVVTHDANLLRVAQDLGLAVHDPLAPPP